MISRCYSRRHSSRPFVPLLEVLCIQCINFAVPTSFAFKEKASLLNRQIKVQSDKNGRFCLTLQNQEQN